MTSILYNFIRIIISSRLTFVLLCLGTGIFPPVLANSTETANRIEDEDKILDFAVDFHLTDADTPFVNSTVSLDHPDAWLFFDNIKPSDVKENHLTNIKINGTQFEPGVNGRLAIYAYGTVVIPHASTFQPLTVYADSSFTGDSAKMNIQVYYNSLGTMDNTITSIKLKRGYMATFATNADGTGYSRVFIADDKDVLIDKLQFQLDNKISFIRVFKYQWTTKKGWCQTGGSSRTSADLTNSTWYYSWSADQYSTDNLEYTVIKQNGGWPGWSEINNKGEVTHALGYNEPDRPDQANLSVDVALSEWPNMLKSGLRIGSPAPSDPFNGWLFEFVDRCDELNYRVDYVAIHCYWGGKSASQWYSDLKYVHDRTGRPIWITEWNNGANWTTESWPDDPEDLTEANAQKQLNDLKAILQVLDTAHFVERYSIYNWVEDARAIILADTLTPAGKYYAENHSRIAYNSVNEVVPQWNYSEPELTYKFLSLSRKINLSWTDDNGELTTGYKIEKKANNGEYETIYSSSDIEVSNYSDDLSTDLSGKITYRLCLQKADGDYVTSNEVSYYQTAGDNNVQVGKLLLNSTDWTACLFSEKYTETPAVILGIPSFNNITALTNRVNSINTSGFQFHLEPWLYLNQPSLSKNDVLSVITMPEGAYNFLGLDAIVGSATDISRDWVTITFEQSFDTVPVVFCSQVSNYTSFPTAFAVRNITKSDFEVRLVSEESITGTIIPERINFFAIEPGNGAINGMRINVGNTTEENGTTTTPVEIHCDTSYAEPVIFAGMLTANDNTFASTLRFYTTGDSVFNVFKQREISGTIGSVKKDKIGWMIMDISDDQEIVGIRQNLVKKEIPFYPNPVRDMMYFDFEKPVRVQIFDISGRKYVDAMVEQSININSLPSGIYLIKAKNTQPVRFIKE